MMTAGFIEEAGTKGIANVSHTSGEYHCFSGKKEVGLGIRT
jgi:hypothetical protein